MIRVPDNILESFKKPLVREPVPVGPRPFYRKWLRYYFYFCHKYQHDISSRESLEPFIEKLSEKNQPSNLKRQASHAISIFYKLCHASQVLRGRQVASAPTSLQKSEGPPQEVHPLVVDAPCGVFVCSFVPVRFCLIFSL